MALAEERMKSLSLEGSDCQTSTNPTSPVGQEPLISLSDETTNKYEAGTTNNLPFGINPLLATKESEKLTHTLRSTSEYSDDFDPMSTINTNMAATQRKLDVI
jgi:hypothetical protein